MVCQKCGNDKDERQFMWNNGVGSTRLRTCTQCRHEATWPSRREKHRLQLQAKRRADPVGSIWVDSRRGDKKAGRENDLDHEFIRETVKDGCSYCGETGLRMTLDRIDNGKGHTRDNVVAACIRCNYTRKDMPYEAWLLVADGMRAAREAGAFGEWTGRCR